MEKIGEEKWTDYLESEASDYGAYVLGQPCSTTKEEQRSYFRLQDGTGVVEVEVTYYAHGDQTGEGTSWSVEKKLKSSLQEHGTESRFGNLVTVSELRLYQKIKVREADLPEFGNMLF